MTELLTAAQMRALEQAAIESGAVTGLELMERAGRGVVEAIFAEWPDLQAAPHKAVVLCGPGNNGGDGFVVARLLHDWGWAVEVFLYGEPAKLPPDARVNHERWLERGVVAPYDNDAFSLDPAHWDTESLLIDAFFGTGLTRPFKGVNAAGWITQISEWPLPEGFQQKTFPGCRIVAIDVPSGFDADSGRYLDVAEPQHEDMRAHLTVTFHALKVGHVMAEGPAACGKVRLVDIGLRGVSSPSEKAPIVPLLDQSAHAAERGGLSRLPGPQHPFACLAQPDRKALTSKGPAAHKYTHGHALILSGPMGQSGAARLAARAALRVGAGLVTVAAPGSAMMECACHLTAIMLKRCDGGEDLATLLEDTRFNALCLGPGLGFDRAKELVPVALSSNRAVVLDADALTAYADAPDALFEQLHKNVILTPHAGEFARLFPDIAEKLTAPACKGPAYSKLDATREAAAQAGCTILFKGPDTVIATPDGLAAIHAAVYDRAAPWLATAGSGDVLAGLIAGLMARGYGPSLAAEAAAWLHVEAARQIGPGLISEDLPEQIPAILRKIAP